jgi:lipooligosaccharide transport system permease protein
MTTTEQVRSTGRALGSWRVAWLRVEGHWLWYRRYWHSNLFSSGLQPVLFLAAMGLGFGSQVVPGTATGGVEYLHYVAPAMLLLGAVWTAVGESSFPVLSGFKWQQHFVALISTPVTPGQILHGQLLWVALRLLLASAVYALVATFFGAWLNLGVLLVVLVGVLTGLACAAPVMAVAAATYDEGTRFVLMFRLVVIPMMLFAGTFFPVEEIPLGLRWLAWISPLWHGTELSRGVTLGGLEPLAGVGHLAFLLALLVVGSLIARRGFTKRLVV